MNLLSELGMYARFAGGFRAFLGERPTLAEARQSIRERLSRREQNFLLLLQRAVFEHGRSPYLALFRLAGCQLGDVRQMMAERGLEATLLALREAGIYVSFEEFKGRQPIVRGSYEVATTARDFDNPHLRVHYASESGGSTGAPTRVLHELDFLAERAVHQMVGYAAHGVLGKPMAVWRGTLPDGSGLNSALIMTRCGRAPDKWFTPAGEARWFSSGTKFRAANTLALLVANAYGAGLPWPEAVPVNEAVRIARWAAAAIAREGACAVHTVASRALRVAVAARDHGIDLTGTTFIVGGEPMTDAKAHGIRSSGASFFPTYGFTETGRVGMGCCRPSSTNDLHLMTHVCAVVAYPRRVTATGTTVPAFNFTGLRPASPKILINAESDDYGVLEPSACGCPLEELGFTTHIREIYSFGKLTGEGVTIVGSDLLRILETVLPERFGGSALDYQLMEEEDADGFTRISLVISPDVPIANELEVSQTVFETLKRQGPGAELAAKIWGDAGSLRIRRMRPALTSRGKLMPLHIARRHGGANQPGG